MFAAIVEFGFSACTLKEKERALVVKGIFLFYSQPGIIHNHFAMMLES